MTIIKNDRLLRAIGRKPVDMTPIWIMRQAGRYLPEYRKTREKAGDFLTLCQTPELACEVTLQPVNRFPLDAAILFSDILTIPHAMGLGLFFKNGEGPCFERSIKSLNDVKALHVPDPENQLRYVLDAIRLIKKELANRIPLIGFCGSPWTLACYMVEGRANPGFPSIQNMKEKEPLMLHHLLNVLAESVLEHLNAQIRAGVDVVMIFDTWGGMLETQDYQTYSLHYIKQIISNLRKAETGSSIPLILFTKGGGAWLELMANSGCDVLGIDWHTSLKEARERVGEKTALQGNMDPRILLSSPAEIEQEAERILREYGPQPGHIFNLGHGITPDVPPEHVALLVDAVHRLSGELWKHSSQHGG